jgi:hypothetical protein
VGAGGTAGKSGTGGQGGPSGGGAGGVTVRDAGSLDAPRDMATPADAGPACTTGGCAAQMYCNLTTGKCAPGCEGNSACITGETCSLPGHSCTCASGSHVCANVCATDSPARCGTGCQVCPATANGDATCSAGACGVACHTGFEACSAGCCRGFEVERVDPPVGGGGAHQPSFVFDGAGNAHVGYVDPTNEAVIHAERVGSVWTLEQVAHPIYYGSGSAVSLAVDAAGDVHLVYLSDDDILHYARRTAGVWSLENVPTTTQARISAAVAVDPNGVVHIAYMTGSPYSLMHAWRAPAATTWSFETIDAATSVGNSISLAIDDAGHLHVAYLDFGNGVLKHAVWNGTAWQLETVDSAGDYLAQSTGLALDAAGRPRIAYANPTTTAVRFAEWTGTSWTLSTVLTEFGSQTGEFPHLALDATGAPWISFYSGYYNRTEIYTRAGTTWTKQLVAPDQPDGYDSAVARDPNGNVAVIYTATNEDNLWMAQSSGTSWVDEVIDPYGDVGDESQMALDGSGRPHISYVNRTTNDVWYATRDASGVWTRLRIATSGPAPATNATGGYTSIALTAAGVPHVVWFDASTGYLQHGSYNASAGSWAIDTVDPAPKQLPSPSIALDSGGQPHIAYLGATGLVVATRGAGGTYTTDAVPGGGTYPFLILDATGSPRLSLVDGSGKIDYAYKQGGTWTVEPVAPATASATGLSLDGNGIPHLCFAQPSGAGFSSLGHAVRGAAGGWTVDGPTIANRDYGYSCSIAIDAQNQPHISYKVDANGGDALEHAVLQGGSWVYTPVDTDLVTGGSSSLRLDATGAAQISYYDNEKHQLRYARQE